MKAQKLLLPVLLLVLVWSLCLVPSAYAIARLYRYYDEFIAAFRSLADAYPGFASYETIGQTVQNRSIIMFKIGNPRGDRLLFDGAIHGDESLGGELLYSYAKWLLTSNDTLAEEALEHCYTLLIPAFDTDNYNIWRKNANGVNLNRNFATDWEHAGSPDPSSGDYRGVAPLSEPETQAVYGVFQNYRPKFYVNLHHGGGNWIGASTYSSRTYCSFIFSKIDALSKKREVVPYSHSFMGGSGFAISDAAHAGATSFLIELANWEPILSLSDVESVVLPKFIPIAAVLSQESEKLFEDSFESRSFSAWNGTYTSAGETASVTRSVRCHGSYGANFTSSGDGGFEEAYVYEDVRPSWEFYARGFFYVANNSISENGDYFEIVSLRANGSSVACAGWARTGGALRWNLKARNGVDWVTAYSGSSPSLNRWYGLEIYWICDASNGYCELYVDGVLACSIKGRNTTAFGGVDQARFGLPEVFGCYNITTVYCDFCRMSKALLEFPAWDLDQDGKVGPSDITILSVAFGSTPSSAHWDERADLDANGKIGPKDFALLASHYGQQYT